MAFGKDDKLIPPLYSFVDTSLEVGGTKYALHRPDALYPPAYVDKLRKGLHKIPPPGGKVPADEADTLRVIERLLNAHVAKVKSGSTDTRLDLQANAEFPTANGPVSPEWKLAYRLVAHLVAQRGADNPLGLQDPMLAWLLRKMNTPEGQEAMDLLSAIPDVGGLFTALGNAIRNETRPQAEAQKRHDALVLQGLLQALAHGAAPSAPSGNNRSVVTIQHRLVHVHTGTVNYAIRDPLRQQRAAVVQAEAAYNEALHNRDRLRLAAQEHPSERANSELRQAQGTLEKRQRQLHQARTNLATGALDTAFAAARPKPGEPDFAKRAIASALPLPAPPDLPPAAPVPAVDPARFQPRPLGPPAPVVKADYDSFYRGIVAGLRGY